MHLLDNETVESMLRDVRLYEAIYGTDPDGARSDLCCHIKALAADRELLAGLLCQARSDREALFECIRKNAQQHDAELRDLETRMRKAYTE